MDRPFPARSWTLYYGAITNALVIFPLLHLIFQVHKYALMGGRGGLLIDIKTFASILNLKKSRYCTGRASHLVSSLDYP